MKIILSPAKKMKYDDGLGAECITTPVYLKEAEEIKARLQARSFAELKKLWACNDKIAEKNVKRLSGMDLNAAPTPAILAYDGIAYQYMAPAVFETGMFSYVQEHLRILSGFYGVLKPMDGVVPYRLEMQAKASIGAAKDLYDYWGDKLYRQVHDDSGVIINLASKEYSRCVEKYLEKEDRFITCTFAEEEKGKLIQKGVYCKMARGEMVRFMAEHRIEDPEQLKEFRELGYQYCEELSSESEYVFLKAKVKKSGE